MEIFVNGHRIDLHYVGYSHVNEFEFKEGVFTSGIAPMRAKSFSRIFH